MTDTTITQSAAPTDDIERARKILTRLCDKGLLSMSIPVRPDDEDLVLSRVIEAAALSATPQAPAEPVGWASPEQLAEAIKDAEGGHGVYVPLRKTSAGKFTMPIYVTPPAPSVQASQAVPSYAQIEKLIEESDHRFYDGEYRFDGSSLMRLIDEVLALAASPAAQPVAQTWTSIADRMPVEGDTVICHAGFTPYLAYMIYGTDTAGNHVDTWTQDGESEQRPTHWMPLPPIAQTRAEPTGAPE